MSTLYTWKHSEGCELNGTSTVFGYITVIVHSHSSKGLVICRDYVLKPIKRNISLCIYS